MIAAMDVVGEKFAQGGMFVPQMLRSAKTMQECVALLKPHFQDGDITTKGRVILGTVKGDLHDIGKNLVAMMLEGAGFQVIDLGIDVPPETIVAAIRENKPNMLGLSALLTTTMPMIKTTIDKVTDGGLRDQVKILVGGAPVDQGFADEVGADGYAPDASTATKLARSLSN